MSRCLAHIAYQLWLPYRNESPHFYCCVHGTVSRFFLRLGLPVECTPPYSSLNSHCWENKYVSLFSPLLTVNLVEQRLFRALHKLPDSAQIKHHKIISRLQRCSVTLSSKVLYSVVLIWKMLTKSDELIASRLPLVNCELHVSHRRSGGK